MLYVRFENGKAVEATADTKRVYDNGRPVAGWSCRSDWKGGFSFVEKVAAELSAVTGDTYVGTDAGDHCYPRFDVIKAPKVGDKASRAFNGDYYPCGEVVKVSAAPALRVITTRDADGTVKKFYRRRLSGAWINNGTWGLVEGHVSKLNPSF